MIIWFAPIWKKKKGGHRPRPVKSSDRTIFVKHFQKHSKLHLIFGTSQYWRNFFFCFKHTLKYSIFLTKSNRQLFSYSYFVKKTIPNYNPQTPIWEMKKFHISAFSSQNVILIFTVILWRKLFRMTTRKRRFEKWRNFKSVHFPNKMESSFLQSFCEEKQSELQPANANLANEEILNQCIFLTK